MLKVERGDKNKAVVALQKKDLFFNSTFRRAIFIAFFFHALFFMLFSIVSFKVENRGFLPIAFVETDPTEIDATVYTELDSEKKTNRLLPFINYPKADSFLFSHCSLVDELEMEEIEERQEINVLDNPFFCLEKDLQHEYFFLEQRPQKKKILAFMQSGLDVDFIEDALLPLLDGLENMHAHYEIKIENKTGKIFWIESKFLIDEKHDKIIKKALKEIRFEKQNRLFFESGEIEIYL